MKHINNLKNIKNYYLTLPKKHQLLISSLSIILLLLLIIPSENASASKQTADGVLEIGKRYDVKILAGDHPLPAPVAANHSAALSAAIETKEKILTEPSVEHNADFSSNVSAATDNLIAKTLLAEELAQEKVPLVDTLTWQTVKVKSGDSLAKIFKRHGFSARTTYQISKMKGEHSKDILKLNVGDILRLGSDAEANLLAIEYPLSKTATLFVNHTDDGYVVHKEEKEVELRQAFAHGTIKSNFWNAAVDAGLNANQIDTLANIFGWDIDFALDIREGDNFHIVYETQYVEGEFIDNGNILSAEFINQNEVFHAIRFTDGDYYTPKGESLRKAFLRAPVNFKYISSDFKPRRFHPISKQWKAHNGTDYRAPSGTPVVASGDGRVTHSTYNQYNGNYVFIQHGDGIVTKYLHFSKRAVKVGQRVKQGQVIGYVGSTGLSEAPHLHYEFLLNGVHRNPRTVSLPDAKPIASQYKKEFSVIAEQRLNELNGSKKTILAMQSYSREESENTVNE